MTDIPTRSRAPNSLAATPGCPAMPIPSRFSRAMLSIVLKPHTHFEKYQEAKSTRTVENTRPSVIGQRVHACRFSERVSAVVCLPPPTTATHHHNRHVRALTVVFYVVSERQGEGGWSRVGTRARTHRFRGVGFGCWMQPHEEKRGIYIYVREIDNVQKKYVFEGKVARSR